MSKRDDRVSLVDMLIYAEEAIEILGETGLKAMVGDRVMQLALQRLVGTVGEAARRVSQQTQEQHPAIALASNYGMRNRLVHAYDRADLKVLCGNVIVNDLPRLVEQLEEIVGRDPGRPDLAVDP